MVAAHQCFVEINLEIKSVVITTPFPFKRITHFGLLSEQSQLLKLLMWTHVVLAREQH